GTVFDVAGKRAERDKLTAQMGQPSFWDNSEKAQQVIQKLKPLSGLINPYDDLAASLQDLGALAELSEEDNRLEGELTAELNGFEKKLEAFELRAMFSGGADASNAFLKIQAGGGGTEACDWTQILMRMYVRWAERHGFDVELIDELRNEEAGIRNATLHVKGEYA